MVVELLTPTFLRHSMLRLRPPCLKRLFRLEADDINLVAVLPCVPFDRDETGDGFDELVHPARRLCVLFLVSARAQVSLEQHHDFRGILHSSIGQPPPPPSRSLLGVVRCLGSNTFSASSADRMPFSITSCFTVFPVRPDSFAISAAFSYPIRRFRVVAMAGLDSPDRCTTSSFAILIIDAATVRIAPLASTRASCDACASKWFSATRNFVFVAALIFSTTRPGNSGCALIPVPTAVPPIASSASAARQEETRRIP